MRVYVAVSIAVLSQASGNVFLSRGMKQIGSAAISDLLSIPYEALMNPLIWIGISFSIVFSVLFAVALSWADLSLVMPVISTQVILNVAFAHLFLGEHVGSIRWTGTLLISIGVILILRTARQMGKLPPESEPPHRER